MIAHLVTVQLMVWPGHSTPIWQSASTSGTDRLSNRVLALLLSATLHWTALKPSGVAAVALALTVDTPAHTAGTRHQHAWRTACRRPTYLQAAELVAPAAHSRQVSARCF